MITEKKPLYLPKYTVRVLIVILLFIIQILISLGSSTSFEATNTLTDILIMIGLFIIGASLGSIVKLREKKAIREEIQNMDASLSDAEIIEKLMLKEVSWWKKRGRTLFSLIMLIAIVSSLLFYSFDFNFEIFTLTLLNYTLTLQGILLLLVSLYYGFRD